MGRERLLSAQTPVWPFGCGPTHRHVFMVPLLPPPLSETHLRHHHIPLPRFLISRGKRRSSFSSSSSAVRRERERERDGKNPHLFLSLSSSSSSFNVDPIQLILPQRRKEGGEGIFLGNCILASFLPLFPLPLFSSVCLLRGDTGCLNKIDI